MKKLRKAAEINAKFIHEIIKPHLVVLEEKEFQTGMYAPESPMQQDKVRSTINQFVRDWSEDVILFTNFNRARLKEINVMVLFLMPLTIVILIHQRDHRFEF